MVGVWLEEHKQKRLTSELKEHQDFMDVLLSVVTEDDEVSSYDVDTIVKATSMVSFDNPVNSHIYCEN